jgi:hypothetical protein
MSDAKFLNGIIVKAPRDGAPDFIKGSISIKRQELIESLNQETGDWINLDIKVSREGKWYAQVNTWKPKAESKSVQQSEPDPIDDQKIPF